jgi:hypothetical protein
MKSSSCTECSRNPKCGWWNISSFCTTGRQCSSNNDPISNSNTCNNPSVSTAIYDYNVFRFSNQDTIKDDFIKYKMQCEILPKDDPEPTETGSNFSRDGASTLFPSVSSFSFFSVLLFSSLLSPLFFGLYFIL